MVVLLFSLLAAPDAVVSFQAFDAENPGEPFTDAGDIQPLDTVYLDGRASTGDIADYAWSVIQLPYGATPPDLAFTGQGTPQFQFWLPVAGLYVACLTVTDELGDDSAPACIEILAVPAQALFIQLTWNNQA